MADSTGIQVEQLSIADANVVLWSKCFSKTIKKFTLEVCLKLEFTSDKKFNLVIELTLNGKSYTWTKNISGDISYTISIYTGLGLKIEIKNWDFKNNKLSFDLAVSLVVAGFPIEIVDVPISVTIPSREQLEAMGKFDASSPTEMLALLELMSELSASDHDGTCHCAPDHRRKKCTIVNDQCDKGEVPLCEGYPKCECKCGKLPG